MSKVPIFTYLLYIYIKCVDITLTMFISKGYEIACFSRALNILLRMVDKETIWRNENFDECTYNGANYVNSNTILCS